MIEAHLASYWPLRQGTGSRAAGAIGTFLTSGLVHAYPYILAGGSRHGAACIVAYFLVQAVLLGLETAVERQRSLSGGSIATPMSQGWLWTRTMLLVLLPSR